MSSSRTDKAKLDAVERFLKSQATDINTQELIAGVLEGKQQYLAKAITLVESNLSKHKEIATQVIHQILPKTGTSIRIGITGVPGVGKSTFIESIGKLLTEKGIKIAVLAVDPSSNVNKGSILGDKTRMNELSVDPLAFVRPSPSSGTLGGVANATRESILLCEAAGYEVIIVETVGVGQSEYLVKEMVDFFLLLMLSGAGDEIQGIKRGIMEMADALFVNKADGENLIMSQKAAQAYRNALHLFPARTDNWIPVSGTCSAIENKGIERVWNVIQQFKVHQMENKWFELRRKEQSKTWLMDQLNQSLNAYFRNQPIIQHNMDTITNEVVSGKKTPYAGSNELMELFLHSIKTSD
ncbi:MAG: LAO/AO transport system kinase [Salibacteraceae bacterium]|jgi:LAO/AO transport system kinase